MATAINVAVEIKSTFDCRKIIHPSNRILLLNFVVISVFLVFFCFLIFKAWHFARTFIFNASSISASITWKTFQNAINFNFMRWHDMHAIRKYAENLTNEWQFLYLFVPLKAMEFSILKLKMHYQSTFRPNNATNKLERTNNQTIYFPLIESRMTDVDFQCWMQQFSWKIEFAIGLLCLVFKLNTCTQSSGKAATSDPELCSSFNW